MRTGAKILLTLVALFAAYFAITIVWGLFMGILHWVIIAAIVMGVGYVVFAIASPRKALEGRRRILP
ncbi:MAG TPA: hypothetical protein VG944_10080 [Fimbriimonas sp.]|nr:hypothetical protein [Fimbriimonas sp.]